METPTFNNPEEGKEWLFNTFNDILQKLRDAKSHKEREDIINNFDMSQINIEDQLIENKKLKDYPDYQKVKTLIFDFFDWTEKNKNINIFSANTKDGFINECQNTKTIMVAMLIQIIPNLPKEIQAYLVLNIFRTIYELNFKNITLILHEVLQKNKKPTKEFYYINNFDDEFKDYPRLDEIKYYFKNDIRNPIAHESWFIKNNQIWMKTKETEKSQNVDDISKQIYELFFFRGALMTYLLNNYEKVAKNRKLTPEQIKQFTESINTQIKELEKN